MANFFARKDNAIIFTGDGELLYYVPEEYFSLKAAVPKGEYIDVIGIFTYALFDKNGKQLLLKRFKCPKMITCKPFEITKDSNFHLEGTKSPAAYRILRFHKGDELISSVFVTQGMDDVEKTLNLLITAHWPDNIPYDEVQDYLKKTSKDVADKLSGELDNVQEEMNNHFTNQKSENARLQKEIAGLKEEKKQLQDLLMALQRKITDLEAQAGIISGIPNHTV